MTLQLRREIPITIAVAWLFAACASTNGTRTEASTARAPSALDDPSAAHGRLCPMQLPDSTVSASDVTGGAALDFTTGAEHIAAVRERVRNIAAVYNHHSSGDPVEDSGRAQSADLTGDEADHPPLGMPVGSATVEEIEGGARLVMKPSDPAQLQALRDSARLHTGHVSQGGCERSRSSGS